MSESETERLRAYFGHDLSEDDIENYGPRLRRQLAAIERLRAWEGELGGIEPAVVPCLLRGDGA